VFVQRLECGFCCRLSVVSLLLLLMLLLLLPLLLFHYQRIPFGPHGHGHTLAGCDKNLLNRGLWVSVSASISVWISFFFRSFWLVVYFYCCRGVVAAAAVVAVAVAVAPLTVAAAASRNQLSLTAFNLLGICAALMDLCRLMLPQLQVAEWCCCVAVAASDVAAAAAAPVALFVLLPHNIKIYHVLKTYQLNICITLFGPLR